MKVGVLLRPPELAPIPRACHHTRRHLGVTPCVVLAVVAAERQVEEVGGGVGADCVAWRGTWRGSVSETSLVNSQSYLPG